MVAHSRLIQVHASADFGQKAGADRWLFLDFRQGRRLAVTIESSD